MVKKLSESNQEPVEDFFIEYQRIEALFSIERCICPNRSGIPSYPARWSLENFFDLYLFKTWNLRGRCISVEDKRKCLKIDTLSMEKHFTKDKFLIFLEYVINVVYQIDIGKGQFNISFIDTHILSSVFENCISILSNLNYKAEKDEKTNELYIVEQDSRVTVVSEKFQDISYKLIEYRRFDLKGDLIRKSEILCTLWKRLEPLRPLLVKNNMNTLNNYLGILFNDFARHNNIEGAKQNNYIKDMSSDEIEKWYDKTFDLFLLAMEYTDYISIKPELDKLKSGLKDQSI